MRLSSAMRLKLKGVNTSTRKRADGSMAVYFYHRATGTPLPGPKGSPEFLAAFAAAEAGKSKTDGTVTYWIRKFEGSEKYKDFADTTKAEYARKFKIIEKKWSRLPIGLTQAKGFRRDVLDWRDTVAKRGRREADNLLGALARVLVYACDRGEIAHNTLADVERLYSVDRSDIIWLPEHIEAFNRVASLEMRQAMMLAIHTGQRQGDLRRLPWSAYDGTRIKLRQGKRGRRVSIKCTDELKAFLDTMTKRGPLVLTTVTGLGWKKRYFAQMWQETSEAAGIKDIHFHDLRGTAVTNLAEAGCTVPEIAALTGHTLAHAQRILDDYMARTGALSDAAIVKLEAHKKRLQKGSETQ